MNTHYKIMGKEEHCGELRYQAIKDYREKNYRKLISCHPVHMSGKEFNSLVMKWMLHSKFSNKIHKLY